MTREEYLDARVDAALGHVQQGMSPEQVELMRETLREQLQADPLLQRILQRATGLVATDNEG